MDGPIKLSGKAMSELVDKGKLKRADVLVTRSKGSLLGWLIRFGTRSYWNHAAMVYVIRNPELGYDSTFIIESGGGGIDIHNIAHYFERPKKYDVGIKRLEKDWFQNDMNDGDGGLRFRRKVRGFALEEIDDTAEQTNADIKDELRSAMNDIRALQKEITDLSKRLMEKSDISWQEKQQIQDLLDKQAALQNRIENIRLL